MVPANTGIFLRGLKLCGESRTYQVLLVSIKKIGDNNAFFRDNLSSIWEKMPYIVLYFTAFFNYCCLLVLKDGWFTQFFFFFCPFNLICFVLFLSG